MNLETTLLQEIKNIIKAKFDAEVDEALLQLQKTRKGFDGEITLVTFPLLRTSKKSPEETGQIIGEALKSNLDLVSDFNIVKGFLNLVISDNFWLNQFNGWRSIQNYGFAQTPSGKTYMVEYSSPNTNKPLHLGHLRNNFLGYSLAEILKANGHKVVKTQIINDRGIHICKSMIAWKMFGNGETPESSGLKGDKLVGKYYVEFDKRYKAEINELVSEGSAEEEAKKDAPIMKATQEMLLKWEAKDPETLKLWETMNQWCYDGFDVTYKTMGVDFDKLYYESYTYLLGKDNVEEGIKKGVFYKKEDGSVWADLTDEGLDHKLVLRSDGTAVYMTQDIGTAIERYKDFPDLNGLIYTVGNEQDYHFKVLFLILKKLGMPWAEECHHLSYGMVDLPEGKMKSREGTVVDADDLLASMKSDAASSSEELGKLEGLSEETKNEIYTTIGHGALKYFLLKVDPKKRILFNPKESIDFQGNTGPFIQYAHARICSILKKGEISNDLDLNILISNSEKDLILLIKEYPEVISQAGKEHSPALLANYTYELVKGFNHFYQNAPILKEENKSVKNFRLHLCAQIKDIINSSMLLLGINSPEQM